MVLLKRYPRRPGGNDDDAWNPVIRQASAQPDLGLSIYSGKVLGSQGSYAVPRVYAVKPFDLSMEIKGSIDFLNRLALVISSSHLGDNRTLAIPIAQTIYWEMGAARRAEMGIAESLIRLSIGIEDTDDLIGDFRQALEKS